MDIERAHRACNVQMMLDSIGVTTEDLIDQLLLRRRLYKIKASGTFYNEHLDDTGYMESCNQSIVSEIARNLNNKLFLQWVDVPGPLNVRGDAYCTSRYADVTVLLSDALARELNDETHD